jgi:hypothetical protein
MGAIMTEPTTWNEYAVTGLVWSPIADGANISIMMTAYDQTTVASALTGTPVYTSAIGRAAMLDMTRFDRFPATEYITVNLGSDADGDVFTVRTWPAAAGESLPPGFTLPNYQKIILQTADGNYITSDPGGFYHATGSEAQAAVFLLSRTNGSPVPAATLYPTFYPYGQRAHWDPLLSTLRMVGHYSVQFVQPVRYMSAMWPNGAGIAPGVTAVPVDGGPIMMQQVKGKPLSSALFLEVVQQTKGLTMPFLNGEQQMDDDYNLYLVYDGELRVVPDTVAENLFSSIISPPPSPMQSPGGLYLMGPPMSLDARLVQTAGQTGTWFVNDGIKRLIASNAVIALYCLNTSNISTLSAFDFNAIPDGSPLGLARDNMPYTDGTRVLETSSGDTYLVLDGQFRLIPNARTSLTLFGSSAATVSESFLSPDFYNVGVPLPIGACLAREDGDPAVYLLLNNDTKRWIVSPAAFARFGFDAAQIGVVKAGTLDAMNQGADINF